MATAIPFIQRPLTVCVAGGTGFVGTALVVQLARAGHSVRVPTRHPSHADRLLPLSSVEVLPGDVYDVDFLRRALEGCDVAINLVGILNEPGHDGAGFRRAHAGFTAALLRAIAEAHVPRLLHMSALRADPQRSPSVYLRTKGEAEQLVRAAAPALGWTIFRPSVIFGPDDSLTRRFARLLRRTAGWLPLARAEARFAPIYVDDVVRAFMAALRGGAPAQRAYELCGPDVLSLEQIVRITARAAGLPCHLVRLPDALAHLQAALMEFIPGKPLSMDNLRSLQVDSVCERDDCALLGIRPASLAALAPLWLRPVRIRAA